MRITLSIRSRLFLTILGIFSLSFTLLFVFILNSLNATIGQEVANDLESDLKYVHSQFYARPMATRYSLLHTATAPPVIEAVGRGDRAWLAGSMRRWLTNLPFIDMMMVLDRSHRVIASAGNLASGVATDLSSISDRAQRDKQQVVAAELVARDTLAADGELSRLGPLPSTGKALVMTVATPVLDSHGDVIGTIIAGDILNRDRELLYGVPRIFGNEVDITVTQGMERIASSREDYGNGWISAEAFSAVSRGETYTGDAVIAGVSGRVAVEGIPDSAGKIVGTLSVALSRSRYEILRGESLRNVIAAGGLGLLLSFLLSYPAALTLTAPIRRICAAARRIREGDLSVAVEERGKNELGELAESFNAMTSSLRERDATIRKKTAEMEEVNDLLGQKVAERTAQLSTEMGRLEAILTSMADGIIAVEWSNRVSLFNPAAQRMIGLAPGAIVGRRIEDLGEYVEMRLLLKYIDEVRIAEQSGRSEHLMTVRGRTLKVGLSRLGTGGRLSDVVISLRDVTADEEMKRIKNDLIIALSHEFKTPLTSMKGALELLIKKDLAHEGRDLLEVGLRNTERLQGIVAELLQITKTGAAGSPVRKPIRIEELLALAEQEVRPPSGVRIESSIASDVPLVYGERENLTQVIVNIIANAAHAGGADSIVRLEVRREGRFVACSVTGGPPGDGMDCPVGVGVAGTTLGSGLGMVFCKEIIEAHNGTISFAGGDWGTEVIFTIPAYEET